MFLCRFLVPRICKGYGESKIKVVFYLFYNYVILIITGVKTFRGVSSLFFSFFEKKSSIDITFLNFSLYIKLIIDVNRVIPMLCNDSYHYMDKFPTEDTYQILASWFFILFLTIKSMEVTDMQYDTIILQFYTYQANNAELFINFFYFFFTFQISISFDEANYKLV